MIPTKDTNDLAIEHAIVIENYPSYTYKMDIEKERVEGHTDGVEAIKQMIYKCINTEKDIYPIYRSFGIQKRDLFGKPKEYAYIVLTRRITDALLLDDRIEAVKNFEYIEEWSLDDKLGLKFEVETVEGIIQIQGVTKIE